MTLGAKNTFEGFFQDPLYIRYKNHLYNYRLRRSVVRNTGVPRHGGRILELGCGISPMLDPSESVLYTDISWNALSHVKTRRKRGESASFVVCEGTCIPFLDSTLDGIVCSEVLEHIEEDSRVLDEITRILKPQGNFVLTCPVRPELYGCDDELVGHYRRYDLPQLEKRLSQKGFKLLSVKSILGPLEKQIMQWIAKIFLLVRAGRKPVRNWEPLSRSGIAILGWVTLPVFILINVLLEICAGLEVRFITTEQAVTVLIQCQKLK